MAEAFFLTVRGLSVGYNEKPLIRDISFQLPKGNILTLIGPNGAGKSTILKTICRQLDALGGTVSILGRDLSRISRMELAKQMSVLLTERIHPELMTCYEVAAMGRYPYTGRFGRLSEEDHRIVEEALRSVRAEDIAERDFSQISDGQRQRVLLARALCQQPEILVLDEPTSFLDIRYKIELLDILLKESREKNLTVILSLHEIDLAEKISDLVMCVKGDTVWRLGKPDEVFRDEVIASLYDLSEGSYLTQQGSMELAAPEGQPRIFVIGGGGHGIAHYRALQKRQIPFSAGILFENDVEFNTARALGQKLIFVPAFAEIGPEAVDAARQELLACGTVLDAGTPVAALNRANGELLDFAAQKGIRIVRSADEMD